MHLEKATTDNVGRVHDVWDVHTATGQWWVVTNPTNLYTQEDSYCKIRDVVLTSQIGLIGTCGRAAPCPPINELSAMLLNEPWELWRPGRLGHGPRHATGRLPGGKPAAAGVPRAARTGRPPLARRNREDAEDGLTRWGDWLSIAPEWPPGAWTAGCVGT